jgi:hypothetical protein
MVEGIIDKTPLAIQQNTSLHFDLLPYIMIKEIACLIPDPPPLIKKHVDVNFNFHNYTY